MVFCLLLQKLVKAVCKATETCAGLGQCVCSRTDSSPAPLFASLSTPAGRCHGKADQVTWLKDPLESNDQEVQELCYFSHILSTGSEGWILHTGNVSPSPNQFSQEFSFFEHISKNNCDWLKSSSVTDFSHDSDQVFSSFVKNLNAQDISDWVMNKNTMESSETESQDSINYSDSLQYYEKTLKNNGNDNVWLALSKVPLDNWMPNSNYHKNLNNVTPFQLPMKFEEWYSPKQGMY